MTTNIFINRFLSVVILCVLICISVRSKAQKQTNSILLIDSSFYIPSIRLPVINNDSLRKVNDRAGKNGPFVFAQLYEVALKTNINGKWQKNQDNSFTWLIGITSKTAFSLNFIIENIDLPNGASFYIINKQNTTVNGPYTAKNMTEDSSLFIEPIPGESVIFKLNAPSNSDTTKNMLTIKKVGHDFRDFFHQSSSTRGSSGSCEHDINCGIGLLWQKEKRAVVQYTYPTGMSVSRCTGTLINNTENNELPYILSANHCIKDAKTAALAVFYFNYENTKCGSSDANLSQSITGAQLLATSKDSTANLDFTLMRLKKAVPSTYFPYYAGWSLKKDLSKNVVALHHPKGDPLKISVENDFIKNGSYTDNGYMGNSHWQITAWDTGATEGGSSGCPLFNANHQIIGTLTGGDAQCGSPINDYFAKFYRSWDYFADSSNQLKYWLDPIHSGVIECSSYDPQNGSGNPVTNIEIAESLVSYSFNNTIKGSWTGYNEIGLKICAEKFTGIKYQTIYALKFPMQLFSQSADVGKITLKIWNGINQPETLLYEHILSKDSITSGIYCLRIPNRLTVGSNFFIGFELSNLTNTDSIFFYSAQNRSSKFNTLYYFYKNEWIQASSLGFSSSLGLEVYVTDNISTTRAITKNLEKLLTISINKLDTLPSKELLQKDSLSNYKEEDWLQLHLLTNNEGYYFGTNSYAIKQFGEKYNFEKYKYISGIKVAIAKNTISDNNSTVTISLKANINSQDSIFYSRTIPAIEFKTGYFNIFKLKNPIKIDSSFYIVLNTENIPTTDTLTLFMGNAKTQNDIPLSFYFSNGIWNNYNTFNLNENLCLSAETWYSPHVFDRDSLDYKYKISNYIKPTNDVLKNIRVYPNPVSCEKKLINIDFGYFKIKNITVAITDMLGRNINTPSFQFINENIVSLSTENISPGIYYLKVSNNESFFDTVPLIILQ